MQLVQVGLESAAIAHWVGNGRLHPVWKGANAVGRPQLTEHGRWMAAVLSCGAEAALSHRSAASLWGIRPETGAIEVPVPIGRNPRRRGIRVYRRRHHEATIRLGIRTTDPTCTLIDLAGAISPGQLEAAVNEADKIGLVDPVRLRQALDERPRRAGTGALRTLLDRPTFTLTDSDLERRFLPIARRAGLPQPRTGANVCGFRVDFHWPGIGLVVETDGLRYHRTPAQQARDRRRDQAHAAAGLTTLRFTHSQVRFESDGVAATLASVALRLRGSAGSREQGRPDARER